MPKKNSKGTGPATAEGTTGAPSAAENSSTAENPSAAEKKPGTKKGQTPKKPGTKKGQTPKKPTGAPKGIKLTEGARTGRDAWGCRLTGKDGQPSRAALINAFLMKACSNGKGVTIAEIQTALPTVEAISNHLLAMRLGGRIKKGEDGRFYLAKGARSNDGIGWGEVIRKAVGIDK